MSTSGDDKSGSKDNGELKGHMVGLNSPWGLLGTIKDKRGLTMQQVLWQDSWINLMLEVADQPRYERGEKVEAIESASALKQKLGR